MPTGDFSYDLTTNVGLVRLHITDTDADNPIFNDREISAFLTGQGDVVKRAAADALDVIATSEALVLKVIRILELQTDGRATAEALRESAKRLRDQADDDDAATGGGFDYAEMVLDSHTRRERYRNEYLRDQATP